VIGTLAADGWAVTFGTARRGLGGAEACLIIIIIIIIIITRGQSNLTKSASRGGPFPG